MVIKKEIEWKQEKECPICKKGRIALGSIFTRKYIDLDTEPYEANKQERNEEEISIDDSIDILVNACDSCGEIFSADIQNDFRKWQGDN